VNGLRARYARIKLPEELTAFVAFIAENKIHGYRSMMEFVTQATRDKVHQLQLMNLVPPKLPPIKKIPQELLGR
jgi:hypothetical protein